VVVFRVLTSWNLAEEPCPVSSSSLIDLIARHLEEAGVHLEEAGVPGVRGGRLMIAGVLAALLSDQRKRRGIRHRLGSLVSVLTAGIACGHKGFAAIAQAAAGWDQEVLAGHGCRVSPRTGLRVAPSERTLGRLAQQADADELEAALPRVLAQAALDPALQARVAAGRAARRQEKDGSRRRRKPQAAQALRVTRDDGWVQAAPGHPFLDRAVTGDPGHVPARPAVAVDGKERKGAKKGGKKKVHLLGAVTHVTGLVIGQDRVAKAGKANEVTHFKPLLAPLPLQDAVLTADAMQATRENTRFLRQDKHAHYLLPVLGNQPLLYQTLDGLDWENTPVTAATSEITRGRVETRTLRVLPCPAGTGFADAARAVLIERYVTVKKNGTWQMRNCEAILYITSLTEDDASAEDLLAYVRGHWTVEHLHWLRDVIWEEDKSLIRTGNAPQVMSAIINLVITLFRLHGVTSFAEETRRCAQDPRHALDLLALSPG
jgi:predicted transposase YbfD/YdcC